MFTYYPALYVFRLSFFQWDLISPDQVFVGFANYARLFASSEFWSSLWSTLQYGSSTSRSHCCCRSYWLSD